MKAKALYGPPGTGKTTELMRRISVARDQGFAPEEIMFLSHTRAGANEALSRLGLQRSDKVCTMHSLFYRLLGVSQVQVVDRHKLKKFSEVVGVTITGASPDSEEQLGDGDQYLSIINLARSLQKDVRDVYYASERPGDFATFSMFHVAYQRWKDAYGFVDFTDMIDQGSRMTDIDHGARIIMVDEAQDLSPLQWQALSVLLNPRVEQVHVAGDDDQAIYTWGGADPHGMIKFEEDHDSERTVLSQSWRLPSSVFDVGQGVIHQIKNRVEKAYRPRPAVGEVVRWSDFERVPLDGDDIMMLTRTNARMKEIEADLIARRVPYTKEGLPGVYDNKWAKGIRAWNKIKEGAVVKPSDKEAIAHCVQDIKYKQAVAKGDLSFVFKDDPIYTLHVPRSLVDFYRGADLNVTPSIRLGTIHSSKGREARRVIIDSSITERISNEIDGAGADDEARVWYVGVTRAKERLDIIEGGYRL